MAEDKAKGFLKKSKWGKLFKEDDTGTPERQGTFKLNDDVVDFLKPSTQKTMPKLNIAVAQRWPDAHEVRASSGLSPRPQLSTTLLKSKRRKNLNVRFVQTPPDIIGEGGDEASDPPCEISRMKAAVSRSKSDRRSEQASLASDSFQKRVQAQDVTVEQDMEFRPNPIRRVQTSHNEASPAMQRKHASPPIGEPQHYTPSLGRTPTAFSSHERQPLVRPEQPREHSERSSSRIRPTLDPHYIPSPADQNSVLPLLHTSSSSAPFVKKQYLDLSPSTPVSPSALKAREMRTVEGAAFRRASAMILPDEDEDGVSNSPGVSHATSNAKTHQPLNANYPPTTSISLARREPSPGHGVMPTSPPESPSSGIEHNPFTDPNFLMRPYGRNAPPTPDKPIGASGLQHPGSRMSQPLQTHSMRHELQQPHMQGLQELSPPLLAQHISWGSGSLEPPQPSSTLQTTVEQQPRQPRVSHDQRQTEMVQQPEHLSRYRALNSLLPENKAEDRSASVPEAPPWHSTLMYQHVIPVPSNPAGSSGALRQDGPSISSTRTSSQNNNTSQISSRTMSDLQQPTSPRLRGEVFRQRESDNIRINSSNSSGFVPDWSMHGEHSTTSPGYRTFPTQSSRSPRATARETEQNLSPQDNVSSQHRRPSPGYQSAVDGNPEADAAFANFAARVAHMRGVFSLTSEKEQAREHCSSGAWLRVAIWWFLKGKAGIEMMLHSRTQGPDAPRRELLIQAHVDLAKTWWILSEPLAALAVEQSSVPDREQMSRTLERKAQLTLQLQLKSMSLIMGRSGSFPPTHALIQGQDTTIWLRYPRPRPEVAALLNDSGATSPTHGMSTTSDPFEALPLGDTKDFFCYGRFQVETCIITDGARSDLDVMPCILTILRGKQEYNTSIAIASQNYLINVSVNPRHGNQRTLTWRDVSWRTTANSIVMRLSQDCSLDIRMSERDFRYLRNLFEQMRSVEQDLQPADDENLVYEARLVELQYAGGRDPRGFPADRLRDCTALVYERTIREADNSGTRRKHRGHRLLLITGTAHKNLSSISHEICRTSPLFFELSTDSTANGTATIIIHIDHESSSCRVLLVFSDLGSRQAFHDVLNGSNVRPDETYVGPLALKSMSVEIAVPSQDDPAPLEIRLQNLLWHEAKVVNSLSKDPNNRLSSTVESETLRFSARHSSGCITDRLNLGKGDMLFRLPCTPDMQVIQVFRGAQEDMTISIDIRDTPQSLKEGLRKLYEDAKIRPTIRTYTFASTADLHAFQASITGFTVRFDGFASSLAISRRRMVVPIYKKWEASNVRVQLVYRETVVHMVAFMEHFSHAETLCFRIKSTDIFENVKSSKGILAVRLVDAKFSLPKQDNDGSHGLDRGVNKGADVEFDRVEAQFVNLEGLEYAEEHDDITVSFTDEAECERFSQALPAPTTVSRGITLKRRI